MNDKSFYDRVMKIDAVLAVEHYVRSQAAFIAAEADAKIAELEAQIESLKAYEPRVMDWSKPSDMYITCAKGFLAEVVHGFDAMNGDCNYSVTEMKTTGPDGFPKKYEVIVRRADKPTDHELRKKTEAELAEAKVKIAELTAAIAGKDCK